MRKVFKYKLQFSSLATHFSLFELISIESLLKIRQKNPFFLHLSANKRKNEVE